MPEELGLNLEDQLIPPATPAPDEASLPDPSPQPQAQADAGSSEPQEVVSATTTGLPPNLTARAQQMGLSLEGIDTVEKFNDFLLDRYAQERPYADLGRSSFAQPVAQQHSDTGNQSESEPSTDEFDEQDFFSKAWTVPALSDGAKWAIQHGAFETSEDGVIVPSKEPHLHTIATQYLREVNDYQQAKAVQNEAFATNPVKFMAEKLLPYFEHKFSSKWQSLADQKFQERDHANFESQFIKDNSKWLYTSDQKAFSPDGLKFVEAVKALRADGITNPQRLAELAVKIAGINTNAGPGAQEARQDANQSPAPNKVPAKDPKTGQFVKQTKQESFLEEARRKASGGGNQGGYADQGGLVIADNEGDLDEMWNQGWSRHTNGVAVK